jgi:uncharacterized protein (DUF934 family)
MHLVKNKELTENPTRHVEDDESFAIHDDVTVSLDRWRREKDVLRNHEGPLGIRIPNDIDVRELEDDVLDAPMLALYFPSFADGRAYSQARILREELDYDGELRATGDVLRDQVFFMHRCGFDALELRPDRDPKEALTAFDDFTIRYQPAVDEKQPLFRRRN